MSRSPTRDLVAGVFVLVGLAAIFVLSFDIAGDAMATRRGFRIYANFDQTGGLKRRAPVEIAGVRVGQVSTIDLAPDFRARVALDVDGGLKLPIDTTASIVTAGLLGDRLVSLQVGGDPELLKNGDEISFTESAVIFERLIGKLVHNADVGESKDKDK
jgi:phospholipid/cholesterol/gamma-HCH transport system substrate-binding protein